MKYWCLVFAAGFLVGAISYKTMDPHAWEVKFNSGMFSFWLAWGMLLHVLEKR